METHPTLAVSVVKASERLLPLHVADALARRLGADDRFLQADGSARQRPWMELAA